MEGTPRMYNQPGPSMNGTAFPNHPYAQQQYGPARGRGGNNHGAHGFQQRQRQPNNYYPNRQPPMHSGYVPVNGVDRLATNDLTRYAHGPNGQAASPIRRGRPHFPPPITSPPIPSPVQMYAHTPPSMHPYFSPGPPSTSPPAMYHYPHLQQPQMQPFPPPPFIQLQSQPPFPYGQHPTLRSPLENHQDQVLRSPELQKTLSQPKPQPSPPALFNVNSPKITPLVEAVPLNVASEPEPATSIPSSPLPESQPIDKPLSPSISQKQDLTFGSSTTVEQPMQVLNYTGEDHEPTPDQEWVISALRPDNPSDAFGIMISPSAKPPPHIVNAALEYASPARSSTSLPKHSKEGDAVISTNDHEVGDKNPACDESPKSPQVTIDSHASLPPQSEPISSSATETESAESTAPDAFVPGSPLSTNTSVSLSGSKANVLNDKELNETQISVATEVSSSPEAQQPAPIAQPPAPSTVKKSWASLLRTEGNSKSSLPTSAVVGFSIPADSAKTSSNTSLPSTLLGKKNELLQLLTNGANLGGGSPNIRPRGLINTGNMCFANAVLQTLVYCTPFYRLFMELGKYLPSSKSESTKWGGKTTPLVDATVAFLKEFNPKPRRSGDDEDDYDGIDSFLPSNIYEAMKDKSRLDGMRGAQQEDAEEFFGFFLDTLEEELLSISNTLKPSATPLPNPEPASGGDEGWLEVGKKNRAVITRSTKSVDSPITRIFGGKFRSTLKVPGQKDSVMVEDWRSLQLDIQRDQVNTIEDALRSISHPQHVQVSSVTKGNAVVDATQQVLVESLPPILVLHLKRFLYDTTAKGVVKIGKQVPFGPELEIPSDAIAPTRRSAHPIKYKLFAVLYHHGQSAAGGHYTLDVLHPNRNADLSLKPREGWVRIDDELVSDLRMQDVFKSDLDDRCAYLLFYRRIGGSYARAGQNMS